MSATYKDIYSKGVNFHGVQFCVNFVRSSYPQKITKFFIHPVKVIRLYHEHINTHNHLGLPTTKFKFLKLITLMVVTKCTHSWALTMMHGLYMCVLYIQAKLKISV